MLFLFKSQVSTLSIRNFLISNVVLSSRSYDTVYRIYAKSNNVCCPRVFIVHS